MFVAIALIPEGPEALAQAAALSGLARADVSRLLAGTLPRVLCRQTGEGARLVQALEGAGFVAFTGEPAAIPTDAHRVVARNLELGPQGLVAVDGRGGRHDCPYAALHTLFRGSRPLVTSETVKTTERRLAMGKALLTGGLSVTKKIETVSERTTTAKEAFILLQCGPDRPEIILYEHRLNYQCLGADLQPSTLGNQAALLARLRVLAPQAPLEDRITRPGFLAGLPTLPVDPVDLTVFLLSEARARGC